MAQQVYHLAVEWDGLKLIARSHYPNGWSALTSSPPPRGERFRLPCRQVQDLTTFELEVWLHAVLREMSSAWGSRIDLLQPPLISDDEMSRPSARLPAVR